MAEAETRAAGVRWDLSDLYESPADPRLQQDLEESSRLAEELAARYRGRIAGLQAEEMHRLIQEYERILELAGKASTFAYLDWSTNTEDHARGALLQRVQEHGSRLQQQLLFLELEWAHAAEEAAQALMAHPSLAHYRHWLRLARRYRPHLLSEPEEKVLAEKAVTGRAAWVRFFDQIHSAARYRFRGQSLPQQSVLTRLYDPDRQTRQEAAASITTGLQELLRSSLYVFNTVLADKASEDRMRSYPEWISARNLDNQISDAMVEALVGAVTSRYDIVERFYTLKRGLLQLPELLDYDRYAPLPASERRYSWQQAQEIALKAYRGFHERFGEIATEFLERRWVDAEVREGKRGGAYSHGAVPSVHPYLFLNFEGSPRHVMTLAHEMGHGVHQYLSRPQGVLVADTPLTTAETASVFGEMLVFQEMMSREQEADARLALLVQKIEDSFATVFRQTAMNRFEDAVHRARRSEGELSAEHMGELWMDTQRAMFRGSVRLTDGYALWWSYVPHFLHAPGYVYAYAFGELLVLALYARYREVGQGFSELYLRLLEAGGSDWPEALVKPLGVDLTDPAFWHKGLAMIEQLVEEAERMAAGGGS